MPTDPGYTPDLIAESIQTGKALATIRLPNFHWQGLLDENEHRSLLMWFQKMRNYRKRNQAREKARKRK